MKLNITLLSLTLATAGCCSAFALSPGRNAATTSMASSSKAAFVRNPDVAAFQSMSTTTTTTTTALQSAASSSSSTSAMATSSGSSSSADNVLQTARGGAAPFGIDIPLLAYFGLWYLGNYYYNITNKLALKAVGGASGFPLTISTLQLGIGSLYGLFLWLAPDAREKPKITFDDVSRLIFNGLYHHIIMMMTTMMMMMTKSAVPSSLYIHSFIQLLTLLGSCFTYSLSTNPSSS